MYNQVFSDCPELQNFRKILYNLTILWPQFAAFFFFLLIYGKKDLFGRMESNLQLRDSLNNHRKNICKIGL